jgi:methylenetetrahydrofolate dehydrogenase (NADP+)/methenyltetrahydrofolate cyclohydrolase
MSVIDGRKVAEETYKSLKTKVGKLRKKPKLTIISVGDDPASQVYVSQKEKAATKIGVGFELIKKPVTVTQRELEDVIDKLNSDKSVSGVLIQKPLPKHINSDQVDLLIDPKKDVDGQSLLSSFIPATTRGICELIDSCQIEIKDKNVMIVGTSRLVGLPTASEFAKRGAKVRVFHSKIRDLREKTRSADILVVAVGQPNLITADMVKEGVVVVDVGINKQGDKLVGDVDFEKVSKTASFITPVPGGVGPMTVAALMQNLVEADSS